MAKHTENDFLQVIPTLLYELGPQDMAGIKEHIEEYIALSPEDLITSESRPGEAKYKQIVGNIRSHFQSKNNQEFLQLLDMDQYENGIYALNDYGIDLVSNQLVKKNIEYIEEQQSNSYVQVVRPLLPNELLELDNRGYTVQPARPSHIYRPKTNPRISKTVILNNHCQCKYAQIQHTTHITFQGKVLRNYVEAHHLIPLTEQDRFAPINLDQSCNIVPLCPTCHSQVHYGCREEQVEILTTLYYEYIDGLTAAGLYITLDELLSFY